MLTASYGQTLPLDWPPRPARQQLCSPLARLRVVVQRDADGATVVAVVLADDLLAVQLPQAGVVVGAGGDEVGRVGAEGAVPDPALVARQGGLEREGLWAAGLVGLGGLLGVDLPDLGGVVGGAGRELLDVRGQQDARDVLLVRVEVRDGLQLGAVEGLDEGPDEDVALFWSVVWVSVERSYLVCVGKGEEEEGAPSRKCEDVHYYWQRRAGSHPSRRSRWPRRRPPRG